MKPRFLIPFLLLAAACGGGSSEPPASTASAAPPSTVAAAPSPLGASVVADVVTIDPSAPSVTLTQRDVPPLRSPKPSDLKPGDRTIRVEPAAVASLRTLKPGMRVRVTCSAPPPAVVVESSPVAGGSPAAGKAGTKASAAPAVPVEAIEGPLAHCDSVVAIAPLESPAPAAP